MNYYILFTMTLSIKDTVDIAFFLGGCIVLSVMFQKYTENKELFTIVSSHYTRMIDTNSLSVRDNIFVALDAFERYIVNKLNTHRINERNHLLEWRKNMSPNCPVFSDLNRLPDINAKNEQLKLNNEERMKIIVRLSEIQNDVHIEIGKIRSLLIYLKPSSVDIYTRILQSVENIQNIITPINDLIKQEISIREQVLCGLHISSMEIDYTARNMAHMTVFGVESNT